MTAAPISKVPAVFLVEDNLYLVEPRGWAQRLYVNGVEAPPGRLVVSDPKSVSVRVAYPAPLLYYKRSEAPGEGARMAPEEYAAERAALVRGREDDDGIDFESLEHEYAYKKFMATWKPVYGEPRVEFVPVDLEVLEVRRESGDPHIRSLWNAPDVVEQRRGLYVLSRLAAAVDAFKERCALRGAKYDIPGHGGLEFVKAEGAYVFGNNEARRFGADYIGSLQDCKDTKAADAAFVNAAVDLVMAKKSSVPITGNLGALITELNEIKHALDSCSVHEKHRNAYAAARARLVRVVSGLVEKCK